MDPVQASSPDHAEFDRMTERVDEFGYLPAQMAPLEERDDERTTELDGLILAGLVSPV